MRLACWQARPRDRKLSGCSKNNSGKAPKESSFRRNAETSSPRDESVRLADTRDACATQRAAVAARRRFYCLSFGAGVATSFWKRADHSAADRTSDRAGAAQE